MGKLWFANDGNRFCDFVIPFSDYIDSKTMAANVARDFVVPAGKKKVFFSITPVGTTFFADTGRTATIPGDVADGSASEMNPAGRAVTYGTTISVITATNGAVITAAYFD
jgi:hypothetical protein